jgi:hypothetical protein
MFAAKTPIRGVGMTEHMIRMAQEHADTETTPCPLTKSRCVILDPFNASVWPAARTERSIS